MWHIRGGLKLLFLSLPPYSSKAGSQSKPGFISITSQLAVGDPLCLPSKAWVTESCHAHPTDTWVLGPRISSPLAFITSSLSTGPFLFFERESLIDLIGEADWESSDSALPVLGLHVFHHAWFLCGF